MNKRIKLTEPIKVWELCEVIPQYEVPQFVCYFLRKEDLDNFIKGTKKIWQYGSGELDKDTTKQILENQKIRDVLLYHYRNAHHTDYDLKSFVEAIIKEATGKDIKELE